MSKTILLKRATEMMITRPGDRPAVHLFPEGTPVLYTRSDRSVLPAYGPAGVDHKISIRWGGDLYERYLPHCPSEVRSPTGRQESRPNLQDIVPHTEASDKLREAIRRYHGTSNHEPFEADGCMYCGRGLMQEEVDRWTNSCDDCAEREKL